jgi:nitrate reductase gamma subunit
VQTIYYIVLVPMVYVSFGVFILGTAVRLYRIFRAPKHPTTLQIYPERRPKWLLAVFDMLLFPTVRRHKPLLWVFLMAFHICLLLLLIGHLELMADFAIFQIIPHEIFLGNGFEAIE